MAGSMFEGEDTLILRAIKQNDVPTLQAALKNGENPFYTDRKNNTYLHYVCTGYRPVIMHIIVGTGINLNAQNRHGNTALHVTALQNECCHVGDLLAAGIDANIKNKAGKTAAEIPTKNLFWKTIYNKYQPGIFEAVANHDVDKVLHLLHCWSRVDTKRGGQTLRQFTAAHKFHDLVFHIDVHRYTLGAIYAVLEADSEKAFTFLSYSKCDVNFLNYASENCHILQHAIKLGDVRLVRMICKANVNVNIQVTVQSYLKAPLFFEAIGSKISEEITWAVLKADADFNLKDERGRNAAIYALDKTSGKISCEVIAYMMSKGLDISQRDLTGVTFRDVAKFARRRDIVAIIDKAYVKTIRSSDMTELERLAVMGYDSLLIDLNYRDTFIYASGNDTEDAVKFTQWLPTFNVQVKKLHFGVQHWSVDKMYELLVTSDRPELLVDARDKGGRSALHICLLHRRLEILKLLLEQPNIEINIKDNMGRTPYHYACALKAEDKREEFCGLLKNSGINTEVFDVINHTGNYYLNHSATSDTWLEKERRFHYGMERQLDCADKYEELCLMMRYKGKQLKHFEKAVCKFKYPVADFSKVLSPLMPEYRDLVFVAMESKKEDIAVRLIQLGTDWTRKEPCKVKMADNDTDTTEEVLLTVSERADQLGMIRVIKAIEKKRDYSQRIKRSKQTPNRKSSGKTLEQDQNQKIEHVRRVSPQHKDVKVNELNGNYDDVSFEEEIYEDEEMSDDGNISHTNVWEGDEGEKWIQESESNKSDGKKSEDLDDYSVNSFVSEDDELELEIP
ncbi:unnamed protein product [Lymnaea stagnalis]|uniref:Uncharacterized protein n=1 Tax=Lymnaea stagnalis TaxID=6523 RepID=A0AAV2IRL4_LYMST